MVVEARGVPTCAKAQLGSARGLEERNGVAGVAGALGDAFVGTRVRVLERSGDARVQRAPRVPGRCQLFQEGVANQRVREAELVRVDRDHQTRPLRLARARREVEIAVDRLRQHLARTIESDRRRASEHGARRVGQPLEALGEQRPDARRQERFPFGDILRRAEQVAGRERAHDRVEQERISARLATERSDQIARRFDTGARAHELRDLRLGEARERRVLEHAQTLDPLERAQPLRLALHIPLAASRDQSDRDPPEFVAEELEQPQRLGIERVEIVEDESERSPLRAALEESADGIEEPEALRLTGPGVAEGSMGVAGIVRVGQQPRNGLRCTPEERRQGAAGRRAESAHDPRPRPQRRRCLAVDSPCRRDLGSGGARAGDEDLGRARLPDPRLAGQQQDAAAARERGVEALRETRSQLVAAHVGAALTVLCSGCRRVSGEHSHRRSEAVAASCDSQDRGRIGAAISDREPCETDRAIQRALGDERFGPYALEQFVLGHCAVARAHQVEQQGERLRLERDPRAVASQLPEPIVQLEVPECEDQARSRGPPRVRQQHHPGT